MSNNSSDYDVTNYTTDELLDLFSVKKKESGDVLQIMNNAREMIAKALDIKNNDLATFLKAAIAKLFLDNEIVQKISPGAELNENVDEDLIEDETESEQTETNDNTNFFKPENQEVRSLTNSNQKSSNRVHNINLIGNSTSNVIYQNKLDIPHNYNSKILQGDMNPTFRQVRYQTISIDSHFRDILPTNGTTCDGIEEIDIQRKYTSTDFEFFLSEKQSNVVRLALDFIQIPMGSYYTFSRVYGNTSFFLDPSNICINIADGNYNPTDMKLALENQIFVNNGLNIRFNFDTKTSKWTIENNTSSQQTFDWLSTNCSLTSDCFDKVKKKGNNNIKSNKNKLDSNLGWYLGFRQRKTVIDASSSVTAQSTYDQFGTKYVILEVDDFNRNRSTENLVTMKSDRNYFKNMSIYTEIKASKFIDITPDSSGNINFDFVDCKLKRKERSARKGTPNPNSIIVGEDNLTEAQKWAIQQRIFSQTTKEINRDHAVSSTNTLIKIPIVPNSNPLVPLYYNNTYGFDRSRTYFGPVNIEKLRIKLKDDRGNILDLNDAEITLSIILEKLYQY